MIDYIWKDLHSTLIKYKATKSFNWINGFKQIYIPLWLNIKDDVVTYIKELYEFTFHSD